MDQPLQTSWRRPVIWAGIPLIIGAVNEFAISAALPQIRSDLGLQIHQMRWMIMVFLIADAVVLVAAGRLGDRVGRRPVLMVGLAVLTIGSVAAAVSPDYGWLLLARGVEGVGAGMMFSGVLAIVTDVAPPAMLGRAFGLWALVGAFGVLLSPIVGGALAHYASWRWILIAHAVLSLIALLLTPLFLSSDKPEASSPHSMRRMLGSANFVSGTAIVTLIYATMSLTFFTLTFYLHTVEGLNARDVGLVFGAYGLFWLVLPPFTGRLADRLGVRVPLLIGLGLVFVGMLGLSISAGGASLPATITGLAVAAIGVSFVIPAANSAAFGHLHPEDRGEASGLNMTVRLIGSILGVATATFLLESISGTSIPQIGVAGGLDDAAMWIWRLGALVSLIAFAVTLAGIRTPGKSAVAA
ncbi:MAG: MFS transporter [Solirubrobacteraceae bacterium]|nr:MFS transporter [Solirubrobacteraceae bacterium]